LLILRMIPNLPLPYGIISAMQVSSVKLSVVVPTKNEEANIGACLDAFAAFRDEIELIVVDNSSPDRTREIAAEKGASVFVQGPERCAQRNRGWREAKGEYVLFVDADMIVPPETIKEILGFCASLTSGEDAASPLSDPKKGEAASSPLVENLPSAFYIPEIRTGTGLRLKARNFERSFYDATCIDGLRVIRRNCLEKVGGYDEHLVACEDWDLDRRLVAAGVRTALTKGHLFHNEAKQDLKRLLKKKAYYSTSVGAYRAKWHDDAICRKQFGLAYRFFGVFVENGKWKKLLRHPILATVMYIERFCVGLTYLLNR